MSDSRHARDSLAARKPAVIGIDASRAVVQAPTGTEYYSRALIEALLRTTSPYRFRLYTRTAFPGDFFPRTTNYEIRAMPFPRLWTHLRLAYEMLMRAPDVLFVPAHVMPPIHPRRSLVTVHDLGYRFFPQAHPVLQRLYLDYSTRWSVRTAEVVIADSYATRNDLVREYHVPAGKIEVVYPSFNSDIFRPVGDPSRIEEVKARYGLEGKYLVSVGTLHPRKNYERLIEAFAGLPARYSLVIVGKRGWGLGSIQARVRALGMTERVKFLDYVPVQDLPALYAGAELAVLPSLYEGFGFPALEAQACETPLVCSNSSSLPEVAGEGAFYFDPQSVGEMCQALRMVLEDRGLGDHLVGRGKENVRRFAWDAAAKRILEVVDAV